MFNVAQQYQGNWNVLEPTYKRKGISFSLAAQPSPNYVGRLTSAPLALKRSMSFDVAWRRKFRTALKQIHCDLSCCHQERQKSCQLVSMTAKHSTLAQILVQ